MATECRIKCKIRNGAFDEEMIARFPIVDSAGNDAEAECLAYGPSVEVSEERRGQTETDGILRAYLLEIRNNLAAVVLPQPTFQNGPSVVVRRSNLL